MDITHTAARLAVLATLGAGLATTTPALAHGTCTRTVTVGNNSGSGIRADARIECTEWHEYYRIRLCIERQPVLTGGGWVPVGCGESVHPGPAYRQDWSAALGASTCVGTPSVNDWRAYATFIVGPDWGDPVETEWSAPFRVVSLC